jgi:peroxiredoxin
MIRFCLFLVTFYTMTCISAQTPLAVARDFSAKDLEGNTHHLYDYLDNDKYVLLDFFTASCGSCQVYASQVSAAYNDFGCNNGNVIVLGINWGSNNANVHAFDSIYGAFYPAISGTQGGGNHVVDSFQILSYPTVILIAPDRQIVEQYIWPPSKLVLDSIISAHGGLVQACNVGLDMYPGQQASSSLMVWPNPASGKLNIRVNASPGAEISIFSCRGILLKQMKNVGYRAKEIWQPDEIEGLQSGLYLVVLKEDGIIVATSKLVIKK